MLTLSILIMLMMACYSLWMIIQVQKRINECQYRLGRNDKVYQFRINLLDLMARFPDKINSLPSYDEMLNADYPLKLSTFFTKEEIEAFGELPEELKENKPASYNLETYS